MGKLPGAGWGNSSVLNDAEAEPTALCQTETGMEKPREKPSPSWIWGAEDITTHKTWNCLQGLGFSKDSVTFPKTFQSSQSHFMPPWFEGGFSPHISRI